MIDSNSLSRTGLGSETVHRRPRILVVSDDRSALRYLMTVLGEECLPWDTVLTNSVRTALAAMERRRFDVLLCDLDLPICAWPEMLWRVRQRDHDLPCVMLVLPDCPALLNLVGAFRVLCEPARPEQLVLALEEALKHRATTVAARRKSWREPPPNHPETINDKDAVDGRILHTFTVCGLE